MEKSKTRDGLPGFRLGEWVLQAETQRKEGASVGSGVGTILDRLSRQGLWTSRRWYPV